MAILPGIQGGGDANKIGAYSINNGKTWQFFKGSGFPNPYLYNSKYYYGGSIMIDPNNCSIVTIVPLNNIPHVSYNFTSGPWYASSGAPSDISGKVGWWFYYNHCVNDRINGKYIYLYDGTKNIYISDNYGLNFAKSTFSFQWNPSLNGISDDYFTGYIQIDYQKEGRICVCQGVNGLWCSNDHGWTFSQYTNVKACRLVGFGPTDAQLTGINETDSNFDEKRSIMYFFGISQIDYANGQRNEGMYYINGTSSSNDSCIKFNNNSYQLGNQPQSMTVDRTIPGRVYVGSSGTGVQFSTFVTLGQTQGQHGAIISSGGSGEDSGNVIMTVSITAGIILGVVLIIVVICALVDKHKAKNRAPKGFGNGHKNRNGVQVAAQSKGSTPPPSK